MNGFLMMVGALTVIGLVVYMIALLLSVPYVAMAVCAAIAAAFIVGLFT